jgi:steroid 5-alpha reductase family enzyme
MALPLPPILSPQGAAEFGRTFAPYVLSEQLLQLPSRLFEAGTDLNALQEVYTGTNPLVTAIAFALAISPIYVVIAEITGNYSQVDCSWSILPSIYNLHYYLWAHLTGLPTDRLQTIALFSVVWSVS